MEHYDAYIEDKEGELWAAALKWETPEGARKEALYKLSLRKGSEEDYKPHKLIVFRCVHFSEEEL